jgi:hypothetical protein
MQDIKIKYNEKATLTAIGGGVSQYKWYDALGNALEGNITSNLTTSTIIYYATSYLPDVSECESSKVPLYVSNFLRYKVVRPFHINVQSNYYFF